jgi:acyl-CoA thioester hydrolase
MKHRTTLRVRFSDTDMLGHVNNARYFTYMEEARVHFLEEMAGLRQVPLILASAKVDFRAQTFYGEHLTIESWVSRIGNSSFDVSCQMFREEDGTLVFEGVAVLVHFDYEAQRPTAIPEPLREMLVKYQDEPLNSDSRKPR